ncbi:uncharacterized protein LOC106152482 [Lingula anatina]|uniref:Netrin receptor UNC5 n=1 Tax=Lingula anatina TaxID=7574 RepID=A0A1S3H5Z6_LINAN|nr:uncharacterized protein LOC106152482 [Lingula anatina]|eukprot:XP_013381545.1 uncharacterized protein LOC106152482 [Lingula anatina]
MGDSWRVLGRALKVSSLCLDDIEAHYSRFGTEELVWGVLEKWAERGNPTKEGLLQAVKRIGGENILGPPMTDHHRDILQTFHPYIHIEIMDVEWLIPYLRGYKILTNSQIKMIRQGHGRFGKIENLLDMLPYLGCRAFDGFVKALEQSGHMHIAMKLREAESMDPCVFENAEIGGETLPEESLEESAVKEVDKEAAFSEQDTTIDENDIEMALIASGIYVQKFNMDHNGGYVHLKEVGVTLVVPRGSFSEGTVIEMYLGVSWRPGDSPHLAGKETRTSPIVVCGPHNLTFKKPVYLSFPHCIPHVDDAETELMFWISKTDLLGTCKWSAAGNDLVVIFSQNRCTAALWNLCKYTTSSSKKKMLASVFGEFDSGTELLQIVVNCISDTPDEITVLDCWMTRNGLKRIAPDGYFDLYICPHSGVDQSDGDHDNDEHVVCKDDHNVLVTLNEYQGWVLKGKDEDENKKVLKYQRMIDDKRPYCTFALKRECTADIFEGKILVAQTGNEDKLEFEVHRPLHQIEKDPEETQLSQSSAGPSGENQSQMTPQPLVPKAGPSMFLIQNIGQLQINQNGDQELTIPEQPAPVHVLQRYLLLEAKENLDQIFKIPQVWETIVHVLELRLGNDCVPDEPVEFVFCHLQGSFQLLKWLLKNIVERVKEIVEPSVMKVMISEVTKAQVHEVECKNLRKQLSFIANGRFDIRRLLDFLFSKSIISDSGMEEIYSKKTSSEQCSLLLHMVLKCSLDKDPVRHLREGFAEIDRLDLVELLVVKPEDVQDSYIPDEALRPGE